MSTILTALKKSQQQRDRDAVPGLSRAPDPMPAPRRRPWSWWMGGALALNGAAVIAALVWWLGGNLGSGETAAGAVTAVAAPAPVELRLSTSERAVVSAPQSLSPPPSQEPGAHLASTTPQVTAPEPATPQVTTPKTATSQVAAAPSGPQPVAAAQPAPRPVAEATPPASAPVAKTGDQEASATPPRALSAGTEPLPAPVEQSEAEDPDPAPPVTSALAEVLPQPVAALSDVAPPTEVRPAVVVPPKEPILEPNPYASLPLLHQLSYSIQTTLPDLSILVHVYGEDPQHRFVIIQRQKYREGDQLGARLKLEAITPSGAVLRYQDTSFRITR